eukprot:gnl/TRDRNA2_/TRDRNA2_176687_c12_seq10.p1 gnl/TRDRNA2_/TRDRNA2_176687_c12~~gnl/TRDRNA2_/TRDRNA2_176687_c12_seq10.p1  ORF type:complete len:239 (-),score=63.12 gnl/TRDRNA2_/TRDRNA2_176687_c12_seq10:108-737(-)
MFVIVNTLTALFVENTLGFAEKDHAKSVQEAIQQRDGHIKVLKKVFQIVDTDHSGTLSWQEFQAVLVHRDEELMAFASSLDVQIEDLKTVFTLLCLSQEGETGVSIEDFVDGCIKLQGAAKSSDLHGVLHASCLIQKQLARMEHLLMKQDVALWQALPEQTILKQLTRMEQFLVNRDVPEQIDDRAAPGSEEQQLKAGGHKGSFQMWAL